jgi:N-acetylglucosaminyldiphosphoundecaprenol N-acetyl-beta-D-mannosaminyltransferase
MEIMRKRTPLFNTGVDNLTLGEAIEAIDQLVRADKQAFVVTPNVDHIVKLQKDRIFQEVYAHADLALTDGAPLLWAARLFGTPIKEKVSGSDLFPALCAHAAQQGHSMFFLGGLDGVAERAKEVLCARHRALKVVGTYSPPFGFENDELENQKIMDMINAVKPDILCVGVGAPKQEKWIYANRDKLTARVSLGIGASFDFVAGTIRRAPIWMQRAGLEWFYRAMKEPRRLFMRYLVDAIVFLPLIVKYKINLHR